MRTIGIVGGGFSGTMAAVNLARFSNEALRVVVINSKRPFGRGTAYGTMRIEHLLNVAARNMSALPDHPSHFVDWLQSRSEYCDIPVAELRELFIPRRVYGDYLRSVVEFYLHPVDSRSPVELQVVDDEAVDIIREDSGECRIVLASGKSIDANHVLLATGNQSPATIPSASPLSHDPRYCADPWENWLPRVPTDNGRIVLLGTGLTMVDVVISLAEIGWQGSIIAVSRNGILPKSHFRGIAYPDFIPEDAESLGLDGIVELVRQHGENLKQRSQNSAIAVDKLRPHTQRLWRSLSLEDKQKFFAEYAARWNATRHRIAQSIHECVTDALDVGRLDIIAGNIEAILPGETQMDVAVTSKEGDRVLVSGDLVINCTGPQSKFSETDCPLFQNLLQRGFVRSDQLDMGLEVDNDFSVIEAEGTTSDCIRAMGPLLKGSLWETTAVPELRVQAMHIAKAILDQDTTTPEEYVIEYCI